MTVATQIKEAPKSSLLSAMAAKYEMDPGQFANAVRKTAMPSNATNEEFAAFMMVAKEYKLNPLLREIHAFPKKGGGIQPVVSIDGWVSLVNQHPQCDGFDFDMEYNDHKQLVSCTCRMHRKDRAHPVVVTEYLVECIRGTEPWKMQHRMLRHKALIQAARYAFGFAGIMDEDEADKVSEMRDITPRDGQVVRLSGPSALDDFAAGSVSGEQTGKAGPDTAEDADEQPSGSDEGGAPPDDPKVDNRLVNARSDGAKAFEERRPIHPPADVTDEDEKRAYKDGWAAAEKAAKKASAK